MNRPHLWQPTTGAGHEDRRGLKDTDINACEILRSRSDPVGSRKQGGSLRQEETAGVAFARPYFLGSTRLSQLSIRALTLELSSFDGWALPCMTLSSNSAHINISVLGPAPSLPLSWG